MRLGYHFSLAEAHLSDLLIKDILEQYDFRVQQKSDSLAARIEKKPVPFLIERLKVLGYLLIHTRQIDMVMGDQGMVDSYRQSLLADLEKIVKPAKENVT